MLVSHKASKAHKATQTRNIRTCDKIVGWSSFSIQNFEMLASNGATEIDKNENLLSRDVSREGDVNENRKNKRRGITQMKVMTIVGNLRR